MVEKDCEYTNFVTDSCKLLKAGKVARNTRRDPTLGLVFHDVREGWPAKVDDPLKNYFIRRNALFIDNNMLMWGYRVIIPNKYRKPLLEEIHFSHVSIVKMKSLARQFFWWPDLNEENSCLPCKLTANNPRKTTLIKFQEAKAPMERIHTDYLGPYHGKMFLVIVDAFSK